jgi:hypothetical protein
LGISLAPKRFEMTGNDEGTLSPEQMIRPADFMHPPRSQIESDFCFISQALSLTRFCFIIIFRCQQESFEKVVHKFTEFTGPAPSCNRLGTFPNGTELMSHIPNPPFLPARSFSQKTPGAGLAFIAGS